MGVSENFKRGVTEIVLLALLSQQDMYGYEMAQAMRAQAERIGLALEEMFNPRMKQGAGVRKLFKALSNTYIQQVFDEMDAENAGAVRVEPQPAQTGVKA